MIDPKLKIGFLASGAGSSAQAIILAARDGKLACEPRLMVSNNRNAPALAFAALQGVPALCVATQADPAAADARLAQAMGAAGVELIVMSGYLRQLGPQTVTRFAGRILNIHPGPLPRFGGHGMYGRHVHEAVIEAGVAESGICVHLVDSEYDRGPVIARRSVPVLIGDTPQTLEDRVKAIEPTFFLETLQNLASGQLTLPNISDNLP